jgi:type IV secretory pathway VirB2 component (pilin)
MAMLLAGLALCGAVTLAQTSSLQNLQPSNAQPSNAQPSHPHYSADGLYNLANSYARAGKPGLAVLNYERAALLAPDDDDINANLEYVRSAAHIAAEPRGRLTRIALAVSPPWGAWIGVVGIALVGLGLLAGRIARRLGWGQIGAILTGAAFIALTASNAMLLWPRMHEAVVLVDQTPARVAPVPMGDTAFMLPEAETVTIAAEHEDFALIRTRRGRSGWVARGSIGAVVP